MEPQNEDESDANKKKSMDFLKCIICQEIESKIYSLLLFNISHFPYLFSHLAF